jgi:hypothetical protein
LDKSPESFFGDDDLGKEDIDSVENGEEYALSSQRYLVKDFNIHDSKKFGNVMLE